MIDFTTMDISTITRSVTGDGVRYLELFLREYVSIFQETVNPSCPKCLTEYLSRYKNHFKAMDNTCQYRLHAKYENIPLEFGSPVLVSNANITDEYAQKLLSQKNGSRFFSIIPQPKQPFMEARTLKRVHKQSAKAKKKYPPIKPKASPEGSISDNNENQ
jgi:hypothetical protein